MIDTAGFAYAFWVSVSTLNAVLFGLWVVCVVVRVVKKAPGAGMGRHP